MNTCKNCHQETNNPVFCSRSCNAIWNNKNCPNVIKARREKTKKCELCNTLVLSTRKFCDECNSNGKDITLEKAMYTRHHKSSAFALVRTRARTSFAKTGIKSCQKCGYDKHIEVCHIKPIADFPPDTMLSEINNLTNLIGLCPNCHWEHDNQKLRHHESNVDKLVNSQS